MQAIDLRSDTITQPTDAMRKAMAEADVGDDVLDEDPTVHRLQNLAAEKLGMEAALFIPSGTMGNLIAVLTHCQRGDEMILGEQSHIFINEVGGISALGGVHPKPLPNLPDGTLDLATLEAAVRPDDIHYPPTRLISLENTHNYCDGSPLTPDYLSQVSQLAHKYGLKLHIDGARIFNAAVALSVDVTKLTHGIDSLMFSLSKGLSAPVGSILGGSADFIAKARKNRKMVGGGMRQAGHLAAAGIIALEQQVHRLAEDHRNAQTLAEGLMSLHGISIPTGRAHSNILFFRIDHPALSPEQFHEKVEARGIRIFMTQPGIFRAVTHRHISEEDIDQALTIFKELLA